MESWGHEIFFCLCFGYFMGCLNPAYALSKLNGFDIRTRGTGNAGASNITMVLGKSTGVFCALFDIIKSYLSVVICSHLYPYLKIAGLLAGVSCILGHIFPVIMSFRGGKGLACIGGTVLGYDAKLFLILLSLEVVVVFVSSYICSVAPSGSLMFGFVLLIQHGLLYALLFAPVIVAVWTKHMVNFRRIRYGVEAKIRILWKKADEETRLRNNWNKLTENEKIYVSLPEGN